MMGILVDVNLKEKDGKQYLEIVTEAYPSPIQIRVYENKLEIINGGVLPEGWTVETLLSSHRSMPYNPDIANTFFRAGEIEAWGRGIERIITACKNDGFSTPEFRYDASGIWTTFKFEYPERATIQSDPIRPRNDPEKRPRKTTQKNDPETDQQKQENIILELIKDNPYIQRKEMVNRLGRKQRKASVGFTPRKGDNQTCRPQ